MGHDPFFDDRPGGWFGNLSDLGMSQLQNEYSRLMQAAAQTRQATLSAIMSSYQQPGSQVAISGIGSTVDIDKMPLLDYLRARTKDWLKDVKL
jgi:hypothetical protein